MYPHHLVLEFVPLLDARALRTTCREFRASVAEQEWTDMTPVRNLKLWRECFPRATFLFYAGRKLLYLSKYITEVHLDGVKIVPSAFRTCVLQRATFHGCRLDLVLPALSYVQKLDLSFSSFEGRLLQHLRVVDTLAVRGCVYLTDDDLLPLQTLTALDISNTYYIDRVLPKLPRLKILSINGCRSEIRSLSRLTLDVLYARHMSGLVLPSHLKKVCLAFTYGDDDSLTPLAGVEEVDLQNTGYDRLTPLQGVKRLDLSQSITRGLRDLRGTIDHLNISETSPFPPSTLGNLTVIHSLTANYCHWLNTDTLKYVKVNVLEMLCVRQSKETMQVICKRLGVKRVNTCECSKHKFKFDNGPIIHAIECFF